MPSLPVWLSVGCQSCRKPRDCNTALLWCGKGEALGGDLCLGVSETARWAQVPACRPDDSSSILASHTVAGKKCFLFVVLWPPHFRICAFGHIPGYLINARIEARHIVFKLQRCLWWWRLKRREKVWATEHHYEQVLSWATSCLGYSSTALPTAPPVSGQTFLCLWWCCGLWVSTGCLLMIWHWLWEIEWLCGQYYPSRARFKKSVKSWCGVARQQSPGWWRCWSTGMNTNKTQ